MNDATQEHDNKVASMLAIVQRQVEDLNLDGLDGPDDDSETVEQARVDQIVFLQRALSQVHDAVLTAYDQHTPVEELAREYVLASDAAADECGTWKTLAQNGVPVRQVIDAAATAIGQQELARVALVDAVRKSIL